MTINPTQGYCDENPHDILYYYIVSYTSDVHRICIILLNYIFVPSKVEFFTVSFAFRVAEIIGRYILGITKGKKYNIPAQGSSLNSVYINT